MNLDWRVNIWIHSHYEFGLEGENLDSQHTSVRLQSLEISDSLFEAQNVLFELSLL